jgi:hypothetical protein
VTSDILSIGALILSALTFFLAQRSAGAVERRSRIPVLVFIYDSSGRWLLRNVGNGPALNIVMAIKESRDDISWQKPTRIPPIGRDGEFQLTWLGDSNVAVMAAYYEDFLTADTQGESRGYTVRIEHDQNRVVPRRELPRWNLTESMAHWQREGKAKP